MAETSERVASDLPERLAVNGVELAWGEWGSGHGTPLVLCHGFSGGAIDFALQIPALAQDRRVIALDLRGHGLSTKTHDAASYSIAQLAEDLSLFLDMAVGEPVDLLGHSMGGLVTLTAVLRRPDLVQSLVLMDTSASTFFPPENPLSSFVRNFMAKFDPARGVPARMSGSPEDALITASTPEDWRDLRDRLYLGMDPWAYKALGTELMAAEVASSLPGPLASLTCPVTVLVGQHDHPLVDQAPDLAAAVPHGRVAVIADAFHSPQLTHPDEWRAALEEHLAVVHA